MNIDFRDWAEKISTLKEKLNFLEKTIDPKTIQTWITELEAELTREETWSNPTKAAEVNSKLSTLKQKVQELNQLQSNTEDLEVMCELLEAETQVKEEDLNELQHQYQQVHSLVSTLETKVLLSGPYDERSAVVTIRAGSGGVDAADFAQMLLRMYLRWCTSRRFPTTVLNTSYGTEAGIKSVTFQVDAAYAYGMLSVEAGTHRLVRISPFDHQHRRHTSFAAVEVIPLIEGSDDIEIKDSDLKIDVFRSSGPGGQSVNTTDSAVRLTHLPTGIVVSMQDQKSQLQNKQSALRILKSRLLVLKHEEEQQKLAEFRGTSTASWGDQMRSYVLQPFQLVKDLRSGYEENNPDLVFDGHLDSFINQAISWRATNSQAEGIAPPA